jgi:hypothetical protein
MVTILPPAGWYPDPDVPGGQRYFDGTEWAEHRAGPPAVAVLPPTPEQVQRRAANRRSLRWLWCALGAVAVLIVLAIIVAVVKGPSASDRAAKKLRDDCYAFESATARLYAGVNGQAPSRDAQVSLYSRCIAVGGPQNMTR